jgi:hypothetical protein
VPSIPYTGDGSEYDVVVGGVPFRLATSQDLPSQIETLSVSKDQFDTERDPGEQSLAGFWRRSQASFHSGRGFLYEPNNTEGDFTGFWDSYGVDVFEPGKVTLLRKLDEVPMPIGAGDATRVLARGGRVFALNAVGDMFLLDEGFGTFSSLIAAPSGGFQDVTYAGYVYGITNEGLIYQIDLSGSSNGYFELAPSVTSSSPEFHIGWAKYRTWAWEGADLFQPSVTGTPDNGAAPIAPFFTCPQPNWTYTAMAEGPSAIYFAGHDGQDSSIQMVSLEADGGLPALTGAITAAVMPTGELVTHIAMVAGQYIGIGTNLGFRVGQIESNGSITYGPLLIDNTHYDGTPDNFFRGVGALCARGDSFLVSVYDVARTYRVPTTIELAPLSFPYARDVEIPDSGVGTGFEITDLTTQYGPSPYGGRTRSLVLYDGVVYRQHESSTVEEGWIQTSRIRFHSVEPKAFKYVDVNADWVFLSSMSVDIIDSDGTTTTGGVLDTQAEFDASIDMPADPLQYASIRVNLNTTNVIGPTLNSILVRALPATKPQRLITLPLLCFDSETTRSGQTYTTKGWARQRLEALQAFEDVAATVTYSRGETSSTLPCVVESVQFIQTSPPPATNQEDAGGILVLKLRTVEA